MGSRSLNIWVNGPEEEAHSEALRAARDLGYRGPRVKRTVLVRGTKTTLHAVVVEEGGEYGRSEDRPARP